MIAAVAVMREQEIAEGSHLVFQACRLGSALDTLCQDCLLHVSWHVCKLLIARVAEIVAHLLL